jgi:O-antigen ligase
MGKTETRHGTSSEAPPLHFAPDTSHFTPYTLHCARILLVAALFGAPLAFGAVLPWAWAALSLAASLGLFLWALGCVQQGALKLIWSPLYMPLALFFLLGVVQYVARLPLDRSETRQALILLATDLVFFFLAVQLFGGAQSGTLPALGLAVLVFAGSLALFAILQFISGAHKLYGIFTTPGSLFGPYVDPDHFAGLMEMLFPAAAFYMAGQRKRLSLEGWVLMVFALMLALASLLLSGSRGGLLALSAEIGIAVLVLRRAAARTRGRRRPIVAAALTLLAGLLLFAYIVPAWVAQKLGSVAYADRTWAEWAGGRERMAVDALRMWRAHAVLGVGLGDFETAYPRYQSIPSDLWYDHAHNDYVEAVAETGLVGAVLIFSALALFLRLAFRDSGQPIRPQEGWIRLGATLGCCGMLVHSLVDFNLHIPANAAWFAVLTGIATTGRDTGAAQDQAFLAAEG